MCQDGAQVDPCGCVLVGPGEWCQNCVQVVPGEWCQNCAQVANLLGPVSRSEHGVMDSKVPSKLHVDPQHGKPRLGHELQPWLQEQGNLGVGAWSGAVYKA